MTDRPPKRRTLADAALGATMLLLAIASAAVLFPRLEEAQAAVFLSGLVLMGVVAGLWGRRALPMVCGLVAAGFLISLLWQLRAFAEWESLARSIGDSSPRRLDIAPLLLGRSIVLAMLALLPFLLGFSAISIARFAVRRETATVPGSRTDVRSSARAAAARVSRSLSKRRARLAAEGRAMVRRTLAWRRFRKLTALGVLVGTISAALWVGLDGKDDRGDARKEPPATPRLGDLWEEPVLGLRFRYLPPGSFVMGSPEDEAERRTTEIQHVVRITRGFWIGETEVTRAQWQQLMGKRYSRFWEFGDQLPIERVNWWEAVDFANELSRRSGLEPAIDLQDCGERTRPGMECDSAGSLDLSKPGYRLPTEAEWEYATRAGTSTRFWTGAKLALWQANYDSPRSTAGELRGRPVAVRKYPPNPWGLYDVHGNVAEWVWDRHRGYPSSPAVDPTGQPWGTTRVARGGHWMSRPGACRSAARDWFDEGERSLFVGFRLARGGD